MLCSALQRRGLRAVRRVAVLLALLGLSWAPAACAQATAKADLTTHDPLASDPVIRFWQDRARAAPRDASLSQRLSLVCLERARRLHDVRFHVCAERAAREALRRAPGDLGAQLLLASSQLAQHRFDLALKTAGQVLRTHPDAAAALALRGDARLALNDRAGARADYTRLLATDISLPHLVRMASLQRAEGDAAGARKSLQEAVRVGGEQAVAPALLGWGLLQLGASHFRSGDWAGAEIHYRQARERNGDDPDVLDHLAELHAARGDHAKALALLTQAYAMAPRPEFQQALGDLQTAMGDPASALRSYRQAEAAYLLAAEAGHPLFDHHLASLYSEAPGLRNPAKALHWAQQDLARRRTAASLDALAWAWYQSGKYAQAATTMDLALQQPGQDAHMLYHASLIYARAGQSARSRQCLAAAATANPKFGEFHFHR